MHLRPCPAAAAARLALACCVALTAACGDDDGAPPEVADATAAIGDFESFRRSFAAGPCPNEMDCSGFIELRADHTLLVDRDNELPVVVHEAEVTDDELLSAVAVLTDRDLVALLDLAGPPCAPPTDIFEQMVLVAGGDEHSNSTTLCDDSPLVAARASLGDLAATHVP